MEVVSKVRKANKQKEVKEDEVKMEDLKRKIKTSLA